MSKQAKLMIAVLGILSLLVVYNVWFFSKRSDAAGSPARSAPARGARPVAAQAAPGPPAVRLVSHASIRAEWGRDPFLLPIEVRENRSFREIEAAPPEEEEPAPKLLQSLELRGILHGSSRPLAIIGQELCRPGTIIEGALTVARIERDRVVLSAGERSYELLLARPTIQIEESP